MIFLLPIISKINAQENKKTDYIQRLKTVFDVSGHKHSFSKPLKNADNELEFLFALLYLSYKNFISSQDIDSCVFYPSCSTYMIQSIQKKGVFIGYLDGMDRLMRCSPFAAQGGYSINTKFMKYEDPVD
jgi:putative membrane protein insertion efficiency factor